MNTVQRNILSLLCLTPLVHVASAAADLNVPVGPAIRITERAADVPITSLSASIGSGSEAGCAELSVKGGLRFECGPGASYADWVRVEYGADVNRVHLRVFCSGGGSMTVPGRLFETSFVVCVPGPYGHGRSRKPVSRKFSLLDQDGKSVLDFEI